MRRGLGDGRRRRLFGAWWWCVAVVAVLVPLVPAAGAVGGEPQGEGSSEVPVFSDVPEGHPFADAIGWLATSGVTTGFEDGTFRPSAPVTRQAMAAFLYRFGQSRASYDASAFSDVPAGHPFLSAIGWLEFRGVTSGYSDGTFRPSSPITRQAMAAFLHRFWAPGAVGDAPGFSDVPEGHPFAGDIGWLATSGVTTGFSDGSFRPGGLITRQAMAAFLWRLAGEPDPGEPGRNRVDADAVTVLEVDEIVSVSEPAWLDDPEAANGTTTVVFAPGAELPEVGELVLGEVSESSPRGVGGQVAAVSGSEVTVAAVSVEELFAEGSVSGRSSATVPAGEVAAELEGGDAIDCGGNAVDVSVLVDLEVDFYTDMDWTLVEGLTEARTGVDANASLRAGGSAGGGVSCSVEFDLPIPEIHLPPIGPFGPIPPIIPVIDWTGELSLAGGVAFGAEGEVGGGFHYGQHYDGDLWAPDADNGFNPIATWEAKSVEEWLEGSVELFGGMDLRAGWFDLVGLFVKAGPYVAVTVTPFAEDAIGIDGGLKAQGGFEYDLWLFGEQEYVAAEVTLGASRLLTIPRVKISEDPLPAVSPGVAYSAEIPTTGGKPFEDRAPAGPYDHILISGELPPGLALTPDGHIEGTLPQANTGQGPWIFTIRAIDSIGLTSEETQLTISEGQVTQISAGTTHTCMVRPNATLSCWGDNTNGQSSPPSGAFTDVAAAGSGTCAIRVGGAVECWGADYLDPAPAGQFESIDAGQHLAACGIRADGSITCWNEFFPSEPPAGEFLEVSVAGTYACGITTNHHLTCWGDDLIAPEVVETPPAGEFIDVAAGEGSACALRTDHTVHCWGFRADSPPSGTYDQIDGGGLVYDDGSGFVFASHFCGVDTAGMASCWGYDGDGQATAAAGEFVQVSAGGRHSCGIRPTGTVACWGYNDHGQATPP